MLIASPPAVTDAETLVRGCPAGKLPTDAPGAVAVPAEQQARAREALWSTRAAASGLCLTLAAHALAQTEPERARSLAALGFVRGRWEAIRCLDPAPGVQGYRYALGVAKMSIVEDRGLQTPDTASRTALRQAAQDDATYRYAIDMPRVCAPAEVRPEAEWPALQDRVRAGVVAETGGGTAP